MFERSSFKFSKGERIYLQKEIEQIFRSGFRYYGRIFSLICFIKKEQKNSRLGILFGHGFKGAVRRNYIKRRIREIFRHEKRRIKKPCDILVHFKPMKQDPVSLSLVELQNEFNQLSEKAGIFHDF